MFDEKFNAQLLSKALKIPIETAEELSGDLLSPIYTKKLYKRGKILHRVTNIPLHKALDTVARSEGYRNWRDILDRLKEFSIYRTQQVIRREKAKKIAQREREANLLKSFYSTISSISREFQLKTNERPTVSNHIL